MKKNYKALKEKKQVETTKLINCIKFAREKFEQRKTEIEALRAKTNSSIEANLKNILTILQEYINVYQHVLHIMIMIRIYA